MQISNRKFRSTLRNNDVLWCLSNGEEWIFGILHEKQSQSLTPLFIDDENPEDSMKSILKMLILWVRTQYTCYTHYN